MSEDERPDVLALVVSWACAHDLPSPHRLLEWHMLAGPYNHPLYGDTVNGITDGVLCYAVFARGVRHVTLGQMTSLAPPRHFYRRATGVVRKTKREPRVNMDLTDLF